MRAKAVCPPQGLALSASLCLSLREKRERGRYGCGDKRAICPATLLKIVPPVLCEEGKPALAERQEKTDDTENVVVVGGGLMGLSVAWRLLCQWEAERKGGIESSAG